MKKIDININMEIQFGERVGHGGGLVNWAYPACALSKFFSLFHRSTTDVYFPQVFAIGSEDAAVKENVTAVAQFVQFAMTQCANCTMTNLSLQQQISICNLQNYL